MPACMQRSCRQQVPYMACMQTTNFLCIVSSDPVHMHYSYASHMVGVVIHPHLQEISHLLFRIYVHLQ